MLAREGIVAQIICITKPADSKVSSLLINEASLSEANRKLINVSCYVLKPIDSEDFEDLILFPVTARAHIEWKWNTNDYSNLIHILKKFAVGDIVVIELVSEGIDDYDSVKFYLTLGEQPDIYKLRKATPLEVFFIRKRRIKFTNKLIENIVIRPEKPTYLNLTNFGEKNKKTFFTRIADLYRKRARK